MSKFIFTVYTHGCRQPLFSQGCLSGNKFLTNKYLSRHSGHSAEGTYMYVRTYVRPQNHTQQQRGCMHAQATHPETNSEKMMLLACSVLRQSITLWSVREWARR